MINPFTTTTPPIVEAFERIRTEAPTRSKAAMILAEAGGHIVLANPVGAEEDQKKPWDVRTTAEKSHDETTYGPDRGKGGAWSATSDLDRLRLVFDRATSRNDGTQPNIGLNVGMSGLIAVDADQAEDVSEVQAAACPEDPLSYVPTTWTPGVVTQDGKVRHKGGAHFLFYDDIGVELPVGGAKFGANTDVFTHEGRYVMVPPSERNGRPYTVAGPIRPLSSAPWLVQFLSQKAEDAREATEARAARAEASQSVLGGGADAPGSIDAWNDAHTWDELLDKAGWERQDDRDGCGCPVWYIPDHGNRRSATAHEPGCTHPTVTITGDSGPLNVWTSDLPEELERWAKANPGTGQYVRVSKAQFSAAMWHAGSMAAFLSAEGLAASAYEPWDLDAARVGGTSARVITYTDGDDEYTLDWTLPDMDLDEEMALFWDAHPRLREVYDHAGRTLAGPYGLLAGMMATQAALLPPHIVLPPPGGATRGAKPGSLNVIFGLVGDPGTGKGMSLGVADALAGAEARGMVPASDLGSRQGLVAAYVVRPTGQMAKRFPHNYVRSRTFYARTDEVEGFTQAMGGENSADVIMRQAWMGEALGSKYKANENDMHVPPMSYRYVGVMGIQPGNGGPLFAQAGGGLPQRLVFLPARAYVTSGATARSLLESSRSGGPDGDVMSWYDPTRPMVQWEESDGPRYTFIDPLARPTLENGGVSPRTAEDGDDDPDTRNLLANPGDPWLDDTRPRFTELGPEDFQYVHVCDEAMLEMMADRLRRQGDPDAGAVRSTPTEENLNAHRFMARLKVAAILSFTLGYDGTVDEEMWRLSGVLMRVHDRTVRGVQRAVREQEKARNKAQGVADHVRRSTTEALADKERSALEAEITALVRQHADADGWAKFRDVRQALSSSVRKTAKQVAEEMADPGTGVLEMDDVKPEKGGPPMRRYRVITD